MWNFRNTDAKIYDQMQHHQMPDVTDHNEVKNKLDFKMHIES